jgi:hypothetical protein
LRKSFLVAGTATLALGVAGVAYAQNPAPEPTVEVSVSPSKAGTKSKPKSVKLKLEVTNNVSESKATASKIAITLPSTLKLSTKGLDQCTATDDELLEGPKAVCPKAIAGKGTAHAIVNPYASPANVTFTVTPLVGKNELLFHLKQTPGDVQAVLHGKISGKKLTISIPTFLQQPAPGTFSALADLTTTLSKKKGKNYLLSTTGCSGGAHKVSVTETFVPNPTPPAVTSKTATGEAKCSK